MIYVGKCTVAFRPLNHSRRRLCRENNFIEESYLSNHSKHLTDSYRSLDEMEAIKRNGYV